MKILVTGGAGFIGSHTVDLLIQQDYEVLVLDNLSSGKLNHLNLNHPQLEFIEGDVLEYPLIEDLLSDCHAVLHLAAIASVPMTIAEPIYCFQVNVQGFLHVLQAAHKMDHSIPIVYASSAAVYGDVDALNLPCRDDRPLANEPISPYALQKITNEAYANLYARLYGVPSVGLRYFNVYGERQDPKSPYSGVISLFLNAYRERQPLRIFGDGQQSRDFIHVHDIAVANLLALKRAHAIAPDQAEIFNIATGKSQTLLQLIAYMEAAGRTKADLSFSAARAGDIVQSYGSIEKAQTELGFHYETELATGIASMIQLQ